MADTQKQKQYLDQTGLTSLVGQIKNRYDAAITSVALSTDGKTLTFTNLKENGVTTIDTSQFVKDGMLSDVKVRELGSNESVEIGGTTYGEGTKVIEFNWNVDGGQKTEYLLASDIGKVYSASDGILLSTADAISVKAGPGVTVDENGVSVRLSTEYTINRGTVAGDDLTLANLLKAAFPSGIKEGLTFEQFIFALAQKEIWDPPTWTVSGTKITLKDLSNSTTVSGHNTLKKLGLYTDISASVVGGAVVAANPGQNKYTSQYSASGTTGFHGAPYTIASYTYATNAAPSPKVEVVFNNGYKTGDSTVTGSQTLSKTGTSTYKPKGITVSLATKSGNTVTPISSTSASGGETATSASTNIVALSYDATLGKGTTNYVHQASLNKANAGFSGSFTETLTNNPIFVDGSGAMKTFNYLSNLGNASDDETWSISDVTSLTNKSNGKFEFTDTTVAASTTSKVVSITGYYPIFTNIVPTATKASKGSSAIITDCVLINLDSVQANTLVGGGLTDMTTDDSGKSTGKYEGNGYLYPLPIDCYNKNAIILGNREGAGANNWDVSGATTSTPALKISFAGDGSAPAIYILAPEAAGAPSLYAPHPTDLAAFLQNSVATVTTKLSSITCNDISYKLWEIKNNGSSEQIVITFTSGSGVLS